MTIIKVATFGLRLLGDTAPHEHSWLLTCVVDGDIEVWDCSCGKRRRVQRGIASRGVQGTPDDDRPGSSVEACLFRQVDMGLPAHMRGANEE